MANKALRQEIDALIAKIGDEVRIARPAEERAVLQKIHLLLDDTRKQRTSSARESWERYLPYAAKLCDQLSKLEEGWEEELEYFSSENAQFWLDNANTFLEEGEISRVITALGQVYEATRLVKRDLILRVDILLQALDIALEISEKKRAIQLYEEAERLYRKHLAGGDQYTGSGWLQKIKKMGQILERYQERLRRYYHHAETVIISIEADTQGDLERTLDYLHQHLPGRIKVTRRIKEINEEKKSGGYSVRVKITLDQDLT